MSILVIKAINEQTCNANQLTKEHFIPLKAANGAKAVEFQEPAEKKASEENIHIEVNGKLSKKRKADYEEFQPEKKKNGLCNNSIITPNFIIC